MLLTLAQMGGLLPFAALFGSYGLLALAAVRSAIFPWTGLVAGGHDWPHLPAMPGSLTLLR